MKVFVTRYDHRHGSDIAVFATAEAAESSRQTIAYQWLEAEMPGPMPEAEPPNVIADLYFDHMQERDEFFSVEECDVEGGATAPAAPTWQVTVRYFTPTPDGIPRFPVAVDFHPNGRAD